MRVIVILQEFVALALSGTLVTPIASGLTTQERSMECIRKSLVPMLVERRHTHSPGACQESWGPAPINAFTLLLPDIELSFSKACGEIESSLHSLVGSSLEALVRCRSMVYR